MGRKRSRQSPIVACSPAWASGTNEVGGDRHGDGPLNALGLSFGFYKAARHGGESSVTTLPPTFPPLRLSPSLTRAGHARLPRQPPLILILTRPHHHVHDNFKRAHHGDIHLIITGMVACVADAHCFLPRFHRRYVNTPQFTFPPLTSSLHGLAAVLTACVATIDRVYLRPSSRRTDVEVATKARTTLTLTLSAKPARPPTPPSSACSRSSSPFMEDDEEELPNRDENDSLSDAWRNMQAETFVVSTDFGAFRDARMARRHSEPSSGRSTAPPFTPRRRPANSAMAAVSSPAMRLQDAKDARTPHAYHTLNTCSRAPGVLATRPKLSRWF